MLIFTLPYIIIEPVGLRFPTGTRFMDQLIL